MLSHKARTHLFGYITVAFSGLLIILPFIWIFIVSLKKQIDIYSGTLQFVPTWQNYNRLLFSKESHFILNATNSAIVAVSSTLVVIAVSTLAAYSISRFSWTPWISGVFLGWTLVFHMIPAITLVGPWYLIFSQLGLYNNLLSLLLTHVTMNLPMAIWLMISFLQDVPPDLEEAALIDGCRRVSAFIRVVLPLAMPGLIAAAILSFVFSWNEFSIALNLTASQTATIPVGIARFAQQYETRHGEMAATAVLSAIPALALMFFGQRFIVKGLTLGALK